MSRVAENVERAQLQPHFLVPEMDVGVVQTGNIGNNQCEDGGENKHVAAGGMAAYCLARRVEYAGLKYRFVFGVPCGAGL